jgi:hypothetical protein
MITVGAWEGGRFIGCVIFSRGANDHIGSPFGLQQTEVCELTRVALTRHVAPVSRIGAVALRMLRRVSPGTRLVVSFADPRQGHVGGIYQAMGWLYVGSSQPQREVMWRGRIMHKRTAHSRFGTIRGLEPSPVLWKYKYLMPLDDDMRARIAPLALPYPRATRLESEAPDDQSGSEGAAMRPSRSTLSSVLAPK